MGDSQYYEYIEQIELQKKKSRKKRHKKRPFVPPPIYTYDVVMVNHDDTVPSPIARDDSPIVSPKVTPASYCVIC